MPEVVLVVNYISTGGSCCAQNLTDMQAEKAVQNGILSQFTSQFSQFICEHVALKLLS